MRRENGPPHGHSLTTTQIIQESHEGNEGGAQTTLPSSFPIPPGCRGFLHPGSNGEERVKVLQRKGGGLWVG